MPVPNVVVRDVACGANHTVSSQPVVETVTLRRLRSPECVCSASKVISRRDSANNRVNGCQLTTQAISMLMVAQGLRFQAPAFSELFIHKCQLFHILA